MRSSPVLAIHQQEYVNDLLQLTLNAKQHENWFSLSNELVQRELTIAQGTITGAQNHSIQKCHLISQGTHHAYSTHGKLLFAQ
jgi:acetoin utilization deacetylase AcuC-like enzyme